MGKFATAIILFAIMALAGIGIFVYKKEVDAIRGQLAQQQQEIELQQTNNLILEEKLKNQGLLKISRQRMKNEMAMRNADKLTLNELKNLIKEDINDFNEVEDDKQQQ